MASPITRKRPNAPQIFAVVEFTFSPIMALSFPIKYMVMPMKGTRNMVMLCANTISSNGKLPKMSAMMDPAIMTREIKTFTILLSRLLLNPKVSPSSEPPSTALPISDEKDPPKRPIRNKCEALSPKRGSSAFPIAVADVTFMP